MTSTPFSDYLRIIGKGINMSRSLTQEEAKDAAKQIFSNSANPMQVGAFLLLLRYRGETAEEIAGLIAGTQELFPTKSLSFKPDIDWPSYADRHKQQPWFVLAALLLAQNGIKILMHGVKGAKAGYAPTRPFLEALGIPYSNSLITATQQIEKNGLAYIGVESFCPVVEALCDIRKDLGVRTVVNTMARALNPLDAKHQLIGVAHPTYIPVHAKVARLLGQSSSLILKGGGGEAQRNPLKPCRLTISDNKSIREETWPALTPKTGINWRNEDLNPKHAYDLWHGKYSNPLAKAAVIATTAIALKLTGVTTSFEEADNLASEMWEKRKRM